MAQPTYYDLGIASINGTLLGQAESCEIRNESTTQDVMTIVGGWSGITPGPDKSVLAVSGFVPRAGFNVDVWSLEQQHAFVKIAYSLVGSTQKLSFEGDVRNCSITSSVANSTKISFEVHGTPGAFE